jgi:hypothetical protein
VKETEAIFEQLSQVHAQAQADPGVLRLSMDSKAAVKVGPFSRHGQTRLPLEAADHDFKPQEVLNPFGIFLPQQNETYLYFTTSSVTADFMVDCLRDDWLLVHHSFPLVKTLLLNLDNGPENHSRRTQFMARLTALADEFGLTIQLAYYPPYHAKYNPIERVWGVLEQHWNGDLLESRQTVLRLASTMTYNGLSPVVKFIDKTYRTGVHLTQQAMKILEKRLLRLPTLPKWFLHIIPHPR